MTTHLQVPIGGYYKVVLREGPQEPGRILVTHKRQCQHKETICSGCLPVWRWDYKVTPFKPGE